jgi:demethylmenaquinone methyltransferase/2-methoxy-6-polyprenyl-1,4-benzoquinol methylase
MARNGQGAYRYLPESVADFPSGGELVKILESSGLRQVRCVPMTFGVASLYLGRK